MLLSILHEKWHIVSLIAAKCKLGYRWYTAEISIDPGVSCQVQCHVPAVLSALTTKQSHSVCYRRTEVNSANFWVFVWKSSPFRTSIHLFLASKNQVLTHKLPGWGVRYDTGPLWQTDETRRSVKKHFHLLNIYSFTCSPHLFILM